MTRTALLWLLAAGTLVADDGALLRDWHAGFTALPGVELRMHKLEVTQEVYQAVMGVEPSRWKGPRNSVEMVSWDEAATFCRQATTRLRDAKLIGAGEDVRLPTEREWELACRAGTASAYSFGDDPAQLVDFAWFTGNAAGNDPPAGAKKPNPWGLYDMHGYVWEWCADATGEQRVARGGAWTSKAEECRSDSRKVGLRGLRQPDLGFRCVLAKPSR